MEVNSLYPPLWYTRNYPESSWIHDWETLARRYLGNDAVIGFDLRNEPHFAGSGPRNVQAYLRDGPTWGPYRGVENRATDWRLAAERAGDAVLAINPHLLIIVQGLSLYPNPTAPNGVSASWWAGILTPAKRYPVQLSEPHQLVYSVHEWGPRKAQMLSFRQMSYRTLEQDWHNRWSFLLDNPTAPYAAPILLGEFGTCTESVECIADQRPGTQGEWFQLLLRFLRQHAISWSFYALNGTNANDCAADNGVLNVRWNNVANRQLQASLRSAQPAPGLLPAGVSAPLIPGAVTHRTPRSAQSPLCQLP
jgi:endoglucanase